MTVHFYTATSLDGFIATSDHSHEWLFKQDFDEEGPMNYHEFIGGIGALVMGSSTYEWLRAAEEQWPYTQPVFVLSSRELVLPEAADVRLVRGKVDQLCGEILEAAGGADVWVVGGGDVAGQFADAGLLDEIWLQFAPVTLGSGQPLLPRNLDLELLEVTRNRAFVCAHYRVLRDKPSAPLSSVVA
ncbi:dihydrofolate reductase family protein [Changpingibacter yushuensis]|uniref:dihydrofolate reductase family protein n=1 Tax=Changpingibacter yushuensis TaxID=2758440 RepID=UPI0015F72D44|nr:dihydrofolate reductase family protein [Changpingibacter yushuensis]